MQRPDEMDGPVKLKTENYITWRENVVAVVVGRRTNLGHFFVCPSVLPLDEACSICNRSKRRAPSMSWPLFSIRLQSVVRLESQSNRSIIHSSGHRIK